MIKKISDTVSERADEVILALNLNHDSGAALFAGGELVAAVSEERLNRIKMTNAFPVMSIHEVLSLAGRKVSEITIVILSSRITPNWVSLFFPQLYVKKREDRFSPLMTAVIAEHVFCRATGLIQAEAFAVRSLIRQKLRTMGINAPLRMIDHHRAHSYSAYSSAPFDNSLIISMDAMGDGLSCMTSLGDKGEVKQVHCMSGFCAPARIYTQVTQLLGFSPEKHEGKITGLAAYGDARVCAALVRRIIQFNGSRFNVLCTSNKRHAFYRELLKHKREDVAAALQSVFEDVIVEYVKRQVTKFKRSRLALAGGVFLNVKVNQRLHEIKGVEEIYVFPHAGDGGLPVGAGFAYLQARPGSFKSIYLGREFSAQEIEATLKKHGLQYSYIENIEEKTAALIAAHKVVGRFNGRMEYGPRALGNRSILYHPDDRSVNDWLNKKLKRTEFMPFAPSTLFEERNKVYTGTQGALGPAQHMIITFNCTENCLRLQPACVHVDNTARPQLVREADNPSYYAILKHFYRMTGIPSVVNTSFNMHEEPIVNNPDDAIKAFLESELDALALGHFLVTRTASYKDSV
jgi:carbamoyltransferase